MQTEDCVTQPRRHPFGSYRAALRYYKERNPARQKYVNVLEPEHHAGSSKEQIQAAVELWVEVVKAMENARHCCGNFEYWVFIACEISEIHPQDIAQRLSLSRRKIRRMLTRVQDAFEAELIARGLIPRQDTRFD